MSPVVFRELLPLVVPKALLGGNVSLRRYKDNSHMVLVSSREVPGSEAAARKDVHKESTFNLGSNV